jgi:hypothetical protein
MKEVYRLTREPAMVETLPMRNFPRKGAYVVTYKWAFCREFRRKCVLKESVYSEERLYQVV